MITRSPAFGQDGLLIVTFDEADATGPTPTPRPAATSSPVPPPALPGLSGPGGGRIGTVLVSPFIRPGTLSSAPYNHYATLATIEDLFGLPRLGQAATVTDTFGNDVFSGYRAPGAA